MKIYFAVDIEHKVVKLYRELDNFPTVGHGLNRPATVILQKVWYNNPVTKQEVRDPVKLKSMDFEKVLRELSKKVDGEFVSYKAENGEWTYKV